jgi:hypothetical protein
MQDFFLPAEFPQKLFHLQQVLQNLCRSCIACGKSRKSSAGIIPQALFHPRTFGETFPVIVILFTQ